MKKNLRIVSAAAAALLAVAPVAATAVNTASAATEINAGGVNLSSNSQANVKINLNGVASNANMQGNITGTITAKIGDTDYTANVDKGTNLKIESGTNTAGTAVTDPSVKNLPAGLYTVSIDGVSFNLGSSNSGKSVKITLPSNVTSSVSTADNTKDGVMTLDADKNGVVNLGKLTITNVPVYNVTDSKVVNFYNVATGQIVQNGDLTIYAGTNSQLNVQTIVTEFTKKYQASQLNNTADNANKQLVNISTSTQDIANQLKAQNISVDSLGYFTAPKSFTVNFTAKSGINGATAQLATTVTVPNGKDTTPATEQSVSAKVMYKSAVYNKDLKNTGKTIAGYTDTNFVAENGKLKEFTINGEHFYKIANEDGYVRARNVTGSKMTLKKNAYVYKSNGKRTSLDGSKKITKGTEVTVYGGEYKAIKGYKGEAVRVGVNKYIKVANVNYDLYK